MNVDPTMPVQYLIHPAMRPWLDAFLEGRGFEVVLLPDELQDKEEDSLPIYMPMLTDERMRRG